MALLPLFSLLFFQPLFSLTSSAECPVDLLDGQMLDFANAGGIRLLQHHKSSSSPSCDQMLTCDVVSAPAATIVEWLYNGKLVRSSSAGTLGSLFVGGTNGKGQLGLSETSHRLCVSDLFSRPIVKRAAAAFSAAEVACRVRLACHPSQLVVESNRINLVKFGPSSAYLALRRMERAIPAQAKGISQTPKAPLIYLITSSRMEMAGHVVQIMCRTSGDPRPVVGWTVFAVDGAELAKEQPIEEFAFMMELNNGDLLVDTSMTDNASLSLRCTAKNALGADSANSTIILLKE